MNTHFIEFERGDRVRKKGDSYTTYSVSRIDLRGAPQYDPELADAVIYGGGIFQTVPVKDLELAV